MAAFSALISERLVPDEYPEGIVNNIYLDTPSFLLIRNSIDAVSYKEKLRLRCYGEVTRESRAFLELKKKYKGVVYKRRVSSDYGKLWDYINGAPPPEKSQIMSEIDYAMQLYKPRPAIFLSYHRTAFKSREDTDLRITFDNDVLYRFEDTDMLKGRYGISLIPDDAVLMEIKCNGGVPIWLAHALDACNIFPTKFSKYGTAYEKHILFKGE